MRKWMITCRYIIIPKKQELVEKKTIREIVKSLPTNGWSPSRYVTFSRPKIAEEIPKIR
jgi:hypothetical protein